MASGETDLERIRKLPYKKAREELLGLFGVGEKVADCICLFALHHLEAFPVDTHISQALTAHYKRGTDKRETVSRNSISACDSISFFYKSLSGTGGLPCPEKSQGKESAYE